MIRFYALQKETPCRIGRGSRPRVCFSCQSRDPRNPVMPGCHLILNDAHMRILSPESTVYNNAREMLMLGRSSVFPLNFPWRARCARRSTRIPVALFQPALAGELPTLCVRGEFDIDLEIAYCTRHLIYRITLERRSVKSRLSTHNTIQDWV